MRPIVFITKLNGGGMETFCLGLLRSWVDAGISPTVYLSYGGGVRESDLPVEVEKVCWNVRAKRSFLRLAKWLRTRHDDPCLALSQELVMVLLVLKELRLIRNRIYFRESTDVEHHYGKRFKGFMRWLWPFLDGMIEQSHVGAEATRTICKGKLPPCIIVRNIMPVPTNETTCSASSLVRLTCLGEFKPMKGYGFLVEELAKEMARDWQLTFWGEGEKKPEVEASVRAKGLSGRIHFKSWEHDKAKIYAETDIVVIPSDYEGLPNVMIEAIIRGKRVSVRPTCAGACELLDEIGIGETWPWRKALAVPADKWTAARERLTEICDPKKVGVEILSFMGC